MFPFQREQHTGTREQLIADVNSDLARESLRATAILGAHYHSSFTDDLEIFYDLKSLRKLAAVIREVKPANALSNAGIWLAKPLRMLSWWSQPP